MAKLTGVSIDILDRWHRTGFLTPSIAEAPSRGVSRVYSFVDLIAIRVACKLRDAGISLQSLRRLVEQLRSRHGLVTTVEALAGARLLTDGHDVFEVVDEVTFSTLKAPDQAVAALAAIGLPASVLLVRLFAIGEFALGACGALAPSRPVAIAMAALYAGFAAFTVVLSRRGARRSR